MVTVGPALSTVTVLLESETLEALPRESVMAPATTVKSKLPSFAQFVKETGTVRPVIEPKLMVQPEALVEL